MTDIPNLGFGKVVPFSQAEPYLTTDEPVPNATPETPVVLKPVVISRKRMLVHAQGVGGPEHAPISFDVVVPLDVWTMDMPSLVAWPVDVAALLVD